MSDIPLDCQVLIASWYGVRDGPGGHRVEAGREPLTVQHVRRLAEGQEDPAYERASQRQ